MRERERINFGLYVKSKRLRNTGELRERERERESERKLGTWVVVSIQCQSLVCGQGHITTHSY